MIIEFNGKTYRTIGTVNISYPNCCRDCDASQKITGAPCNGICESYGAAMLEDCENTEEMQREETIRDTMVDLVAHTLEITDCAHRILDGNKYSTLEENIKGILEEHQKYLVAYDNFIKALENTKYLEDKK